VVHWVGGGLGQSCEKYVRSDVGDSCQSNAVESLLKLPFAESVNASTRGDPNGPVRIFGETSDDNFRELVFQRLDESASVKEVELFRPSLAPGEPKASTPVFEWEHAAGRSIGLADRQERILLRAGRAADNKPRMQMQERRTPYPADLFAGDAIVISARRKSSFCFLKADGGRREINMPL
jgi:hypothetical protein